MRLVARRLAVCSVVLLCCLLETTTAASAPAPKNPFAGLRLLTIKTVPTIEGFRVTLDGSQYTTGADGTVRVLLTKSQRSALSSNSAAQLQPLDRQFTYGFVRAQFHGWYSGGYHFGPGNTSGLTEIASFDVDYLTGFTFTNADGAPVAQAVVKSMQMKSSEGATIDVENAGPVWLRGRRVATASDGVTLADVDYRFTSVVAHGVNVVTGGRQHFVPARTQQVSVPLRLYRVAFDSTGLFGERQGTSFEITMLDGTTQKYRIRHAVTVVPDLPPGDYDIQVRLHGIGGAQKATVARDQTVSLRVLGVLDLGAIAAAVFVVFGGLLLLGLRARRRSRTRAPIDLDAVSGRADLQPEDRDVVLAGREQP